MWTGGAAAAAPGGGGGAAAVAGLQGWKVCVVAELPPPSLGTEAGSRQGKQADNQVEERG